MKKWTYNIVDTLNLEDSIFRKRPTTCYSQFLKSAVQDYYIKHSYKIRCFHLAIKIVKEFWNCVIDDMLENDVTLVLSEKPLIELKISYLTNFNSKKYYYNPKTNGKYYKLYVIIGGGFGRKMNVFYFSKSEQKFKKELGKRIDQGCTWS